MKDTIQQSLRLLVANRYLLVLTAVMVLLALGFAVYVALSVRPSELQLVSHYSAFGVTQLYRDQWFYLLTFGLFGLLVAAIHGTLALKLLIVKGHSLAIACAWLGIAMILFAWTTAIAVINVWSPS